MNSIPADLRQHLPAHVVRAAAEVAVAEGPVDMRRYVLKVALDRLHAKYRRNNGNIARGQNDPMNTT